METCCNCFNQIPDKTAYFHFRKCLNEHGRSAHRVCEKCWWEKIIPWSQQLHLKCPGCVKHLPLIKNKKSTQKIKQEDIITIDDD